MMRYLIISASIIALAAQPVYAQEDESDEDQEDTIIVTGSLVQRSDYQLSSPVDVIGRERLEASAPANIAEFVKDLPYNTGSAFASGRAFGNETGAGSINLRGLGASATLVLINGRRMAQLPSAEDNVVDVNSLVPEIMLQRLEILKDGASALYGSDAVAGVVNFITNENFEGLKVNTRVNTFTYSNAYDYHIEAMMGTPLGERGHITAAFGFHDQDPIDGYALTTPSQEGTLNAFRFSSTRSNPGEFVVPRRSATGAVMGNRTNVVDPLCGVIPSSIASSATAAVPDAAQAVDCRYQFWADNGSQSEIRRYQGFMSGYYELTDTIQFNAEFGFADVASSTGYTVGDTLGATVTIPGHNPGNIFRAVDAAGNPLYAVSSGISAGYVRDGSTVFLPSRNSTGQVILTSDPTNAASGIPFYEDVGFVGRPLNSQCGLATGGNFIDPGECAATRRSDSQSTILRAAGGLEGELGPNWNWNAGGTWSNYKLSSNGTIGVALNNEMNFALNGLGGPNCNRAVNTPGRNGCEYFNLFGNSATANVGDARANSQAIIGYVIPFLQDQFESTLVTFDAVVSGSAFELPAGSVGLAGGYQYRDETLAINYDTQANLGNKANGVTQRDFENGRATHALFMEVNVPVLDGAIGYFEVNGALRHEWIGDTLETTDPKIGFLYHTPNDALTLRGSWGTSFIAPSLFRLYASSARGAGVNDCPVSQGAPCTGDRNLRIALIQKGNLGLLPERSEALSLGAVLRPVEGLQLEATWWNFKFEDRINTLSADAIVAIGPNGTAEFPIVRDPSGSILSVTTSFFNQAAVEVEGIDFSADYTTDFIGNSTLNLNVAGTKTTKYDSQATRGGPIVDGNGRSFTSSQISAITPNTDLRINSRITWSLGGHRLSAAMRYYGPIDLIDNQVALVTLAKIDSWMPIDLSYTYTFDVGSREVMLGVGAQNVFGEFEPFYPAPSFQPFAPTLNDTRGRSIYARAGVTF